MGIYDNLAALAAASAERTSRRCRSTLTRRADASVEIHFGWGNGRRVVATVAPSGIATFHVEKADQGINLLFAELGLGAIVNHGSVTARHLYWYQGRSWPYHKGLQVDLASGQALVQGEQEGAAAPGLADLAVDPKARHAFLKLVRSKVPQALSYLRVSGIAYIEIIKRKAEYTPARFVQAVRNDETALIAAIPVSRLRSWKQGYPPSDPLHLCYSDVLDRYIDQNRAELYHAAGAVRPKEPA